MLSLADSDKSRWRDRTASTLDTIDSVGIRLGVTECFSPYVTVRESRFCPTDEKKYSWPSYRQFLVVFCLYWAEVLSVFVLASRQRTCHCCYAQHWLLWQKWTHLLTTNKLTKNLNATPRQHFNESLTAKYLPVNFRLRRRLHSSQPKGSRSSFGIPWTYSRLYIITQYNSAAFPILRP